MVPEERKSIRSFERIRSKLRSVVWVAAETLEAFFDTTEKKTLNEKGLKVAELASRFAAYFAADWGINALQAAFAVAMKAGGVTLLPMFAGLWVFDFIAAGIFVVIYEVTGKDLTGGTDTRRAANALSKNSEILGLSIDLGNTILAITWTGPERVIAFRRREIGSISRVMAVLVTLTGIQAFIWTLLYSFAYDWVMLYL